MQVQEINIFSPMINALPANSHSGMMGKPCHYIKSTQLFQLVKMGSYFFLSVADLFTFPGRSCLLDHKTSRAAFRGLRVPEVFAWGWQLSGRTCGRAEPLGICRQRLGRGFPGHLHWQEVSVSL